LDSKNLCAQTHGILAAPTELAFATEKIGLDGDAFADFPVGYVGTKSRDLARDFTAGRAREFDGKGQAGFFEPEIEMIQTARVHLHDRFARAGLRVGEIAQFKFSGRTVGDELHGFHAGSLTQRRAEAKAGRI
jgi:hypothetical protein